MNFPLAKIKSPFLKALMTVAGLGITGAGIYGAEWLRERSLWVDADKASYFRQNWDDYQKNIQDQHDADNAIGMASEQGNQEMGYTEMAKFCIAMHDYDDIATRVKNSANELCRTFSSGWLLLGLGLN